MTVDTGNASDNGAPVENGSPAPAPKQEPAPKPEPGPVPYARFAELNQQKKAAEDALASVVEELSNELPEAMRALIPALAPVDKVAWLRAAKASGLFTQSAPQNSPDSKRPGGKTNVDLNGLSPLQKLQHGFGQK